jgi:hypothetical protein
MTALASSTEAILEKLMRLANGNLELVQEALAQAAREPGAVPKLEAVVEYIVRHRKQSESPESTEISTKPR